MRHITTTPSNRQRPTLLAIAVLLLFAACEKVTDEEPPQPVATSHTALILNEGGQGSNNATLSKLDMHTGLINNSWFSDANGSPLGDVAQDLIIYGSKAYVTVFGSGCLWAIDTATGVGQRLDLGNRGPRYIVPHGGSLYITCYRPNASVIKVDTATFSISGTVQLGTYNPEGIAAIGEKLYVASSWSNSVAGITYDSLLYIIDIATMQVDTTLAVGINPQKVLALPNGQVAVNCWGAWNTTTWVTEGEGTAIVDVSSMQIRQVGRLSTNLDTYGNSIVSYARSYSNTGATTVAYFSIDPLSLTTTPLLEDCTISNPYAIGASPDGRQIYVCTDGNYSSRGDLLCYSATDGSLQWTLEVGWFPSKVVCY